MEKQWLYGIIGLLGGVLIATFVASNAVNTNNTGMMQMMGMRQMSSQTDQQNMMSNIDAHFIEQMIPHHEDAITMADIALEKAQHQEIKQLSNDIKRTQSAEINQMTSWYKDWFGIEVPKTSPVMGMHGMGQGEMHMGMMGDVTDIDSLRNSSNFDKEFIEQMIPHHQMAVMMAGMLRNSTNRPEMKKLAQDIISAQTSEINKMREWYSNWGF